jgi:hypothetical protein
MKLIKFLLYVCKNGCQPDLNIVLEVSYEEMGLFSLRLCSFR